MNSIANKIKRIMDLMIEKIKNLAEV